MNSKHKELFKLILNDIGLNGELLEKDPVDKYLILHDLEKKFPKGLDLNIYYAGGGDEGHTFELNDIQDPGNVLTSTQESDLNGIDYWELLEDTIQYDWYNNDGGDGNIVIDVVKLSISVEGSYYEIVSTDCQSTTETLFTT